MAAHDVTGPYNWVHDNEVGAGCYGGIRINNTNNTFVENNTLTGNSFGIRVGDLNESDQSWIVGNTVTGNSVGILLGAADAVVMRDNVATGNSGYGLDVSSTANDYSITYDDLRLNRYRLTSSDGVFRDNQL
jgi:parallel beta-helix repeat protein